MKRDILAEMNAGLVSIFDAEAIFDEILASESAPFVQELLSLSDPEWTAHGHGVGLEELARWRSDGWPAICSNCGKAIEPEQFGWLAVENADRTHRLVHVRCLSLCGEK